MIKKIWEYNKFRFICVGAFNTLLDLSILNTLVYVVHFPIWLSNTISVGTSVSLSYFLNHYIVFQQHNKPTIKQYLKFFFVTGISVILLQTLIIYLTKSTYLSLVHSLINTRSHNKQIALNLAKITAVLIGLIWNFFFYSKVIFKKDSKLIEEERSASSIV